MTAQDAKSIEHGPAPIEQLTPEVTEADVAIFHELISTELTPEQERRIAEPERVFPRQDEILALHWHPEHLPIPLVRRRIEAMFPGATESLIIPTQHNVILPYDGYSGVEIDCYSRSFNRKVQLLFHFANERLEGRGDVFKAMVDHTMTYRASQLFEFIDSVLEPDLQYRVDLAAERTGADQTLIDFCRIHVRRLRTMIDEYEAEIPPEMVKNKLVRNYVDSLRDQYDNRLINHAQLFLRAVKKAVKREFSLDYFYETEEVIEEGRALGGCVVVPHPEQFWPILLEELDIDGVEIWNPQSFEFTRFLVDVVHRQNQKAHRRDRPLLVTMGDDCHLGEKVKDPRHQDEAKAGREIGLQPPWDDLGIRKRLIAANTSRLHVIREYRARLQG